MNAPESRVAGGHTPVLLAEVLDALAPRDGGIYVDGTFGAGGYSRALLNAARCTVWGIDRDPAAIERAGGLEREFAGRFAAIHGHLGDMVALLDRVEARPVDGVAFDLGVSSMQLEEAERGFSFRLDGPLDMRMDGPGAGPSAADIVNNTPEGELADILYTYGEERRSRRIARAIVAARADAPIRRTGELAQIVRGAVPPSRRGGRGPAIDPSTRTFQALRIYVNDEMGELDRGLAAAEIVLAPGGRLAIVSFHSLEDRRVKAFLRERSGAPLRGSRHKPEREAPPHHMPSFTLLRRGAVKPSKAEIAANPRARSARLRAARRTAAPAWPSSAAEGGAS